MKEKEFEIERILVVSQGEAEYGNPWTARLSECAPDTVIVRTTRTAISCGTEKAAVLGERIGADASRSDACVYPRSIGYAGVGVVEAVGPAVKRFRAGDRVTWHWGQHATYQALPEANVLHVPSGVSDEAAAFSFIATFPMAALRKTRLSVAEPCLVMGLGLLGQIAVMLAAKSGAAPLIAADPVEERRKEALAHGADYALDPLAPDFVENALDLTHGGARVAVEVTGQGAGLNETLDVMRRFGRVALLGCTRDSNFQVDYYRKVHGPGITLIGAHTNARPSVESSEGWYTHADDQECVLDLQRLGRIDLASLLKETHRPEECNAVFRRLASDRNFPIGVQFDWTKRGAAE